MDKTRVDDMLIEMIEPKIQEINKKFSNGAALTQEDINTLLLKSQYNHINHLDSKLNEVTASVVALENKFENKFMELENKFVTLENKFDNLKTYVDQRFETFEQRFEAFEQKIETTIQKALNKNMMMLIFVIGFFLTLSKLIDKF